LYVYIGAAARTLTNELTADVGQDSPLLKYWIIAGFVITIMTVIAISWIARKAVSDLLEEVEIEEEMTEESEANTSDPPERTESD